MTCENSTWMMNDISAIVFNLNECMCYIMILPIISNTQGKIFLMANSITNLGKSVCVLSLVWKIVIFHLIAGFESRNWRSPWYQIIKNL